MRLTDAQMNLLGDAGALVGFHASVISTFELELLAEVASRFRRGARSAEVTSSEWAVIEDAVGALRAAERRAPTGALGISEQGR
ncbi:MAG: hypothetical protein AB1942_20020 [Pseudomonadota bacterium]